MNEIRNKIRNSIANSPRSITNKSASQSQRNTKEDASDYHGTTTQNSVLSIKNEDNRKREESNSPINLLTNKQAKEVKREKFEKNLRSHLFNFLQKK